MSAAPGESGQRPENRHHHHHHLSIPHRTHERPVSPIQTDTIPQPCYSDNYGEMNLRQKGFGTKAKIASAIHHPFESMIFELISFN